MWKQEQLRWLREEIILILNKELSNTSSDEAILEMNKLKKSIPKFPQGLISQYELDQYFSQWDSQITYLKKSEELREKHKREILREQELVEEEEERQIQELFEFKKKHNSEDALPLDKKYPDDIELDAATRFRSEIVQNNRIKETTEEAMKYYSKNSLDSKPRLDNFDEDIYAQVREKIKAGIISAKKDSKKAETITIKGNFYRAKDLDYEIKKRALEEGFIHIRGVELNGKFCGGGFYIRKDSNESDYHFVMKHLLAELSKHSKIEYAINGRRADVAMINGDLKLGIEIETGSNNSDQLKDKTKWLNENFTYWIIVCSRENLSKFNQLVDNKKSFCFTAKAAMEKVLQLFPIAV